MRHEMGAVLIGERAAQGRVLGDEEIVMLRPDGLQVEALAHVTASRGRQADSETLGRRGWFACGQYGHGGAPKLTLPYLYDTNRVKDC